MPGPHGVGRVPPGWPSRASFRGIVFLGARVIWSAKEAADLAKVNLQRTRLPDYSIGATVLMVAIALPFFIFTRAEHQHRASARLAPSATLASSTQTTATPGPSASSAPTTAPAPSEPATALPLTADAPSRPSRLLALPRATARATATPPSTASGTPVPPPPAPPDFPPVVLMSLSTTEGPAPLTVSVDATGSSDTDQTPISQVFVNFGDGTTVLAGADRTASHTYNDPGYYTLTVL